MQKIKFEISFMFQDSSSILGVEEEGETLEQIDGSWRRKKKKQAYGFRRFFEKGIHNWIFQSLKKLFTKFYK